MLGARLTLESVQRSLLSICEVQGQLLKTVSSDTLDAQKGNLRSDTMLSWMINNGLYSK